MEQVTREELWRRLTAGTQHEAVEAADELVRREDASGESLGALGAALQRPEGFVRSEVAAALGRLGAAARPALPILRERMRDENPLVCISAAVACFSIEGAWEGPVDVICEVLAREDNFEESQVLKSLVEIASRSEAAARSLRSLLPMLERRLIEARDTPSYAVADALIALAPDEALERFERLLGVPGPHREALTAVLGRLGEGAVPLLKALSREPLLRIAVLQGLYALTTPNAEALALVVEMLAQARRVERLRALAVPERWGPQAASVLPTLRPLMEDSDPFIRLAARDAWKAVAQEEPPPLPAVDPESWEGLFERWVETQFRRQHAMYAEVRERSRRKLAQGRAEDWRWMQGALEDAHRKWFVADLLKKAPVPRKLLRPMVAAAVHEPDASHNRWFVQPCVETYGAPRVLELLQAYVDTGSPQEREGAQRARYWCGEPQSGVKRGPPRKRSSRD